MAKKAKRKERQLKAQNHYTRNDFEVRPVTKNDKWCRFQSRFKSQPNPEAPYGYLVTIPNYFNGMELDLNGYVIKSRLFMGTLYLQVATGKNYLGDGRNYCTTIHSRQYIKKNGKKKRSRKATTRFLNIRNLAKVQVSE